MDYEKILIRVPTEIINKMDEDGKFKGLTRTAKIIFILNDYYKERK